MSIFLETIDRISATPSGASLRRLAMQYRLG